MPARPSMLAAAITAAVVLAACTSTSDPVADCADAIKAGKVTPTTWPTECDGLTDAQKGDAMRRVADQAVTNPATSTSPTTATPAATHVDWGKPFNAGPYTITITRPVDTTEKYPCSGCRTAIFDTTITITANEAIELSAISGMLAGKDANYGVVSVTSIGSGVLPAGARRVAKDVQIHLPDDTYRHAGFTLTLHDDSGRDLAAWTMPASGATQ